MKRLLMIGALVGMLAACGYDDPGTAQPPPQQTSGGIDVLQPMEGATVAAGEPVTVEFNVDPSPAGDHLHITAAGDTDVVMSMSGTHEVGPFDAGRHTITIEEVDSGHSPTGLTTTISLNVE